MKTTINGKEIKVLGRQDIATLFTAKVNEYLSAGFIFYVGCGARGSQGEESKVCLTNNGGHTVYMIYMYKKYNGMEPTTMSIYVRRYRDVEERSTLWLNEGEEVYMKSFFLITEHKKELYVENPMDCKLLAEKQIARWEHRYNVKESKYERILPESTKKIALEIVRRRKGFKSTQLKNIEKVVMRKNSIGVHIAGKGYVTIK